METKNFVDKLTEPGFYYIPFYAYDGEDYVVKSINVEIVSIFMDRNTQFIVVVDREHEFYYTFYYNGNNKCFKPAWDVNEDLDTILRWLNQDEEPF